MFLVTKEAIIKPSAASAEAGHSTISVVVCFMLYYLRAQWKICSSILPGSSQGNIDHLRLEAPWNL